MRLSKWISESRFSLSGQRSHVRTRIVQSDKKPAGTKVQGAILLVFVTAATAAMTVPARSQSILTPEDPSETSTVTAPTNLDMSYVPPTERTKVNNYAFDAFGPYPIAGAGVAAGMNQWTNSPPEWGQGAEGFGKRLGSDFGIAAIGTTTRYGLAEAFREDTLYYRCECAGPFPRLRHAMISTLDGTPRRRRPSRLLFLRACRALCGFHGCGLRVVSGPLRGKGCVPDGQLRSAGIYGRQHCPGVLL